MFQITRANDWAGSATLTMYAGLPVLETRPEESEALQVKLARLLDEAGCDTGIPFFADTAGRPFSTQQYNWQIVGRANHAAFRDLLYTLEGRRKSLWLPTFADDLTLAAAADAAATTIDVRVCGYALSGGPRPSRQHIRIERRSGAAIHCMVAALDPAPPAGLERLLLDTALPAALTLADVKRISFMDVARLDQDAVEIHHYTDTDGVSDTAGVFRHFSNTRVGTGSNFG